MKISTYGGDIRKYWRIRQSLRYFQYTYKFVNALEECSSILDVGGGPSGFLQKVDPRKYTKRVLLDLEQLEFTGEGSTPPTMVIEGDFLDTPLPLFDVVVCLQVMEHILDKHKFATKLLRVAQKYLIVTVPYKWAEESCIDENMVASWFKTPFEKKILTQTNEGTRLFCLFRK